MQDSVFERLMGSVDNLEQAIAKAKQNLSSQPNTSDEIIERLTSYQDICKTQRGYSSSLRENMAAGNHDEVTRLVKLINSLSAMILDDIKLILVAATSARTTKTYRVLN